MVIILLLFKVNQLILYIFCKKHTCVPFEYLFNQCEIIVFPEYLFTNNKRINYVYYVNVIKIKLM